MLDDLAHEKRKYWNLYQHKRYRRGSPGEREAAYFLFSSNREQGDTVIDLGCGTGRAGKHIAEYNKKMPGGEPKRINVTLFDFVDAREVDLPFIEGNIWDLNGLPVFDWILCCDVLEHVPPQYVDQTLDGMAEITRKGGLLTISHIASSTADFGVEPAEDLHLTIEPAAWWHEKVESRWQVKEWRSENGTHSRVILGAPHMAAKKKRKPKPRLAPTYNAPVVASCWVQGCTVRPPQDPCPKHGPKPETGANG